MRAAMRLPLTPLRPLLLLVLMLPPSSARTQDTEAAYVPADLKVPDGYLVEIAAAPPLVHHPTMIDIDSRGRMLVAESSGQNLNAEQLLQQHPGRILMLEDHNDDGRFDASHVFADNLTLPQGVLCYRDAVYVCAPPSLIRFRDTDDDGRADERTVLVDGFGFTGNAASVHGPFLAPSGRLFICQGRKPHELRDADGNLVNVGLAARIWSCRVDGTDLRQHAGGGMDNPVEVDFTDDGQVLGTVNLLHGTPRDDALIHWITDGVYPRSEQAAALAEFRSTGPLLNAGVHFGHIAVSGVTRYRGGAMGEGWDDRWLVTEFNRGQLLRVTLRRDGASFGGDYESVLTSNSENFHPTDVMQDDRGDVLLVDTGGWFRNGCPSSRYARPQLEGAVYRIRPAGELRRRAQPDGTDLEPRAEIALRIEQLTDPNIAVARQAMDRLAQLGPPAVAALRSGWQSLGEAARLQAVWAICRSEAPQAVSHLTELAGDAEQPASVRTAALVALSAQSDPAAWPVAIAAVDDADPRVARQAAALIAHLIPRDASKADSPHLQQAARVVWQRLPQIAGDAALEHQMINVLIRSQTSDWVQAGLRADEPPIRGRAALLMLKAQGGTPGIDDLLRLAESSDAATRSVAIDAVLQRDDAAATILRWTADHITTRVGQSAPPGDPIGLTDAELQHLLTSQIGQPAAVPVVAQLLETAPPDAQQLVLQAIAAGPSQQLPSAWQSPLRQLIAEGPDSVRLAAIEAVGRLTRPAAKAETADALSALLLSIGRQSDAPLALRVAAWRALAGGRALHDEGFQLLVDQLDPADLSPQRSEAASILGQVALSPAQLKRLAADYLPRLHPLDMPVVLEAFAGSGNTDVGRSLLQSLSGPVTGDLASLSLEQLDRVMRRYPEAIQRDAEPIRQRLRAAETARVARLSQVRDQLPAGDVQRGAAIFASEKAACIQCHRIGDSGAQVGPDLSQIGRIRTTDDLLESIVLPSATIARDFETYSVLTSDGRLLAGLVKRLADGSVEVTGADGKPQMVGGDEVESITPSTTSVMPAGLDGQLTLQQLSDLVAFLRSHSGP